MLCQLGLYVRESLKAIYNTQRLPERWSGLGHAHLKVRLPLEWTPAGGRAHAQIFISITFFIQDRKKRDRQKKIEIDVIHVWDTEGSFA